MQERNTTAAEYLHVAADRHVCRRFWLARKQASPGPVVTCGDGVPPLDLPAFTDAWFFASAHWCVPTFTDGTG